MPPGAKPADFDLAPLELYLRSAIPGAADPITLERIEGGQSNPTFFLTTGARRLVLRKQPPGVLLPSAHAIDREFRVMKALAGSQVPVPEMVHYCSDPAIIGTPFYLMGRVDGRVFSKALLPGVARDDRPPMYRSLGQTLAALHNVDVGAVGLADFGRQGGYFSRQIARWSRQWDLSRLHGDADIDRLREWLPANIPQGDLTTLTHGDFRMGNVIFDSSLPRVAAVLDWELATLGHPLADLAHCAIAWHNRDEEFGGVMGADLRAANIPSQSEFEESYYSAVGHNLRMTNFHMIFALFRFAVVFEGIAARARAGNAADKTAASVGYLAKSFATRAVGLI